MVHTGQDEPWSFFHGAHTRAPSKGVKVSFKEVGVLFGLMQGRFRVGMILYRCLGPLGVESNSIV